MLPLIGLGIGLVGGVGRLISRGKANKDLKGLMAKNPTYRENPLAKQRLGLAQSLLNARMPGAATAEKNIFANQANQISNINRGATDSAQALALATGTQGQTNQAISDLGQAEAGDYQRRFGNYANAQEGVINEQDKVYQDQVRRFGDMAQIQGQVNQNRQNSWGEVANLGFGLANFGMGGGFDGMFKQGGNSGGMGRLNMGEFQPWNVNQNNPSLYPGGKLPG
jgi:hypothetical protein